MKHKKNTPSDGTFHKSNFFQKEDHMELIDWDDDDNEENKEEKDDGTVTTHNKRNCGILTIRAWDGYFNDTQENMKEVIETTMRILLPLFAGAYLIGTMEWDKLEWFPCMWMHFWHYHGHILWFWNAMVDKFQMRELAMDKLRYIWGPNMFNKGWFVFGQCGKKQYNLYINYLNKQNHPQFFAGITNDKIEWHNKYKKFDPEKAKVFNYGIDLEDKRYQASRVLEKELGRMGFRWIPKRTGFMWKNINDNDNDTRDIEYLPNQLYHNFCRRDRYRVFIGKLGSMAKWNLNKPNEKLSSLQLQV